MSEPTAKEILEAQLFVRSGLLEAWCRIRARADELARSGSDQWAVEPRGPSPVTSRSPRRGRDPSSR